MKVAQTIALFTVMTGMIWPTTGPSILLTQKLDLEFNRSEEVWGVYQLDSVRFNNDITKSLTVALLQNGQMQLISPQKVDKGVSDVVVENFSYTLNDKKDKMTFNLEGDELEKLKRALLREHIQKTEDENIAGLRILNDSIECDRSFKTIKCSLMLQ